jgi:methylated-DNA-[protein]-cysteine S-methyltransferase
MTSQQCIRTPLGWLRLTASSVGLQEVSFVDSEFKVQDVLTKECKAKEIIKITGMQLDEYFKGHRRVFDIPFDIKGSDFQMTVWRALGTIAYGQTVSYKDIAHLIKNPLALRAVGTANSCNPICIIIPCHRVINADGRWGGYAYGVSRKTKLLSLEKSICKEY